jgi:anti-anti-sigma regulatory factor
METVPDVEHARQELEERGRELDCLHAALDPARTETATFEEVLQHTINLIPLAFRNSGASARTRIEQYSFQTKDFRETPWVLTQNIVVKGQTIGAVEVHCHEETSLANGPFLKGKLRFLEILAARLGDLVHRRWNEYELEARLRLIEAQQQVFRDLSVPVLEVWNEVLLVPLLGVMDSVRTAELLDTVLSTVSSKGARFVILDMTGIHAVDTRVASHLIELGSAIRLLGAAYILTGIQADVAKTMIALGIDFSGANPKFYRQVKDVLPECLRRMAHNRASPTYPSLRSFLAWIFRE